MGKVKISVLAVWVQKLILKGFSDILMGGGVLEDKRNCDACKQANEIQADSDCYVDCDVDYIKNCMSKGLQDYLLTDVSEGKQLAWVTAFRKFVPYHATDINSLTLNEYDKLIGVLKSEGKSYSEIEQRVKNFQEYKHISDIEMREVFDYSNFCGVLNSVCDLVNKIMYTEESGIDNIGADDCTVMQSISEYYIITDEPADVVRRATLEELNEFREDYILAESNGLFKTKLQSGRYEEVINESCLSQG